MIAYEISRQYIMFGLERKSTIVDNLMLST